MNTPKMAREDGRPSSALRVPSSPERPALDHSVGAHEARSARTGPRDEEGQPRARKFHLARDEDVSGVSGVGIVAEGIEFSDGTVALRWLSANPTSVVFHDNGLESVEAIHGHSGATRIVMQGDREMHEVRERLREQVEAKRDEARSGRNAAPPGSRPWILNAGRVTAYDDILALLEPKR